jgi:hypothetical protein
MSWGTRYTHFCRLVIFVDFLCIFYTKHNLYSLRDRNYGFAELSHASGTVSAFPQIRNQLVQFLALSTMAREEDSALVAEAKKIPVDPVTYSYTEAFLSCISVRHKY